MKLFRWLGAIASITIVLSVPVRATAPALRYTFGDGTVHDTKTGLTWQRRAPADTSTWAGSKLYCAKQSQQDGTGWRLPTIQELQTLVDETQIGPAIDPIAFPSQPDGDYWTSTLWDIGTSAWKVDFHDGSTNTYDVNALRNARCVR